MFVAESWLQLSLIISYSNITPSLLKRYYTITPSLSTIEEIEDFNGGRIVRTDNGHLYIRNVSSYIIPSLGDCWSYGAAPYWSGNCQSGVIRYFLIDLKTDIKFDFYALAREH